MINALTAGLTASVSVYYVRCLIHQTLRELLMMEHYFDAIQIDNTVSGNPS